MLGVVFRGAQNRIQDPAKLRRLIVDLIDKERWMTLDVDVKGDAYEGLLQRNAEDLKSGAGQYFTPRPLIRSIVEVMRPETGMTICDPACGTGGFLLATYEWIVQNSLLLDPEQRETPCASVHSRKGLGDRRQHCAPLRHEPPPAWGSGRRTHRARSLLTMH